MVALPNCIVTASNGTLSYCYIFQCLLYTCSSVSLDISLAPPFGGVYLFHYFYTHVWSYWDFTHGEFGLLSLGKAGYSTHGAGWVFNNNNNNNNNGDLCCAQTV